MKPGTLLRVVLIIRDEAGQSEVSDLAHQLLPHQDVGSPQVSVDVIHALHVGHARSYLRGAKVWRAGSSQHHSLWGCRNSHTGSTLYQVSQRVQGEGPHTRDRLGDSSREILGRITGRRPGR